MTEDVAEGVALRAIDQIVLLRAKLMEVEMKLRMGFPREALGIVQKTLKDTDYGKMKVWQPGEEPF